jgi:hypothetical protein
LAEAAIEEEEEEEKTSEEAPKMRSMNGNQSPSWADLSNSKKSPHWKKFSNSLFPLKKAKS